MIEFEKAALAEQLLDNLQRVFVEKYGAQMHYKLIMGKLHVPPDKLREAVDKTLLFAAALLIDVSNVDNGARAVVSKKLSALEMDKFFRPATDFLDGLSKEQVLGALTEAIDTSENLEAVIAVLGNCEECPKRDTCPDSRKRDGALEGVHCTLSKTVH